MTVTPLAIRQELALIDLLREAGAIMAREGVPPSVAARRVLEAYQPEPEVVSELLVTGLAARLQGGLHTWRRGQETPVRAKLETLPPLELALVGADGQLKPLRDFTSLDCHALLRDSRSQLQAWNRRIKLAGHMTRLLGEHHVERLGDLPADLQVELNSEALEAWS